MTKKKLTWEECHAAGMSAVEAAAARGMKPCSARQYARNHGFAWASAPQKVPPPVQSKPGVPSWEECHAAGMTAEDAAEARGMKVSSAYSYAQRRGFRFPTTIRASASNGGPTSAQQPCFFPRPSFEGLGPKALAEDGTPWGDIAATENALMRKMMGLRP